METKHTKSELLYIEEHQSCQNYMTTIETGFKYLEFAKNVAFEEDNTTKNYLLFFLKGDFTICCNQFHNKLFHAGEMILIPRSSRLKGFAETDSSLLSMFFDIPAENCDKLILQSLQSPNQKIPDRKTKCVIKTHINIKQNVIFGAKLKPV